MYNCEPHLDGVQPQVDGGLEFAKLLQRIHRQSHVVKVLAPDMDVDI